MGIILNKRIHLQKAAVHTFRLRGVWGWQHCVLCRVLVSSQLLTGLYAA